MRSVVVTGVSTGIGHATVASLIRGGFHVFGSVRTAADAARLTADYPQHFTPLLFDVTDAAAIAAAAQTVADSLAGQTLAGLVNNAGIAVAGPLLHLSAKDLAHQFEVNLFAVHTITQAFAPMLGTDRSRTGPPGRIVMISSVAGKNTSPFVGAYAASKHALEGYSGTLRRELMLFGIDVIIVGPGAIKTPIWDKPRLEPFLNTPFGPALRRTYEIMQSMAAKGLAPERCADLILEILTTPRPKVRYALVPQPLVNWYLPRWLPARWVDRIVASRLGLKPPEQSR